MGAFAVSLTFYVMKKHAMCATSVRAPGVACGSSCGEGTEVQVLFLDPRC